MARDQMMAPRSAYHVVEPEWRGETVVILGCGPSLTERDVESARGRCRVLAINTAVRLAPWADALYACDERWWANYQTDWRRHDGAKYTISEEASRRFNLRLLNKTGTEGFDDHRWCLRTGQNSGHQALHLAGHLGASRVLLLGYDMQLSDGAHFHGRHPIGMSNPKERDFMFWREHLGRLGYELGRRGVEVINASRATALRAFPRLPLEEVLP